MKHTKYILSLMLAASLTGCIKEDRSECPSNCKLLFSYVGDGTTQIFQDKIHKVDMYVFDSNGRLLSSHPVSEADVKRQETELMLAEGDYRLITIGNLYETEVSGKEDLARAVFHHRGYTTGTAIAGNDSLYYAGKDIRIPGGEANVEEVLPFASSHYKVHVEVIGVTPEDKGNGAAAWPVLSLQGVLPVTDFHNVAGGTPTTYYPQTENNAEKHTMLARFNIMRHTDSSGVVLELTAPDGTVMAGVNLADFLAAHPVIDLNKHEVLIPIRIEFKSVGAEITIPDWFIVDVKPEY